MTTIHVDPETLTPLVKQIVATVVAELTADQDALPGNRLCWSEAEAAALLGLQSHQLRDERLRGRIAASSIVGRRIVYTRDDLLSYLRGRRWAPTERGGVS